MNRHLKPRTIKEWLELIPFDRARREAFENVNNNYNRDSLSRALLAGFDWSETDQGHQYWQNLYTAIHNMEKSVKLK